MALTIAGLPFHERPVLELLNVAEYRDEPDHDFAGYGWARVPRLWLVESSEHAPDGHDRDAVDDVLLVAVHTADDAPDVPGDLQLEFETPDGPVAVMASKFLSTWLPRLPAASAVVLCVCNPHRARLHVDAKVPVHVPMGDVHSWRDHETQDLLLTAETWSVA